MKIMYPEAVLIEEKDPFIKGFFSKTNLKYQGLRT